MPNTDRSVDRSIDSFQRLFRILQLLPRAPRWIDSATLAELLVAEGFTNVRRTLQRDLVKLERMGFGLQSMQGTKPYRWRLADTLALPVVPSRFDGPGAQRVDVMLRLDRVALDALMAEPLVPHQRIVMDERGRHAEGVATLHARTALNGKLRARLLAFGPHVDAVSPIELRDDLAETHRAAWERYARARKPQLVGGMGR